MNGGRVLDSVAGDAGESVRGAGVVERIVRDAEGSVLGRIVTGTGVLESIVRGGSELEGILGVFLVIILHVNFKSRFLASPSTSKLSS